MTERKCQWEVHKALKAINHKLAFVTSDNPAAARRFMEENFSAKRHDATTIKNNVDYLSKLTVQIDELSTQVTEDDNALFDSMACQQPQQPPLRNVQQQVTLSLSKVETDSQSDVVDQVVGSSPSSLSNKSSPEPDLIPEAPAETLPPSKYGRQRTRVERDNYVTWDKIAF